jgi:hypothetical protein
MPKYDLLTTLTYILKNDHNGFLFRIGGSIFPDTWLSLTGLMAQ